MVEPKLAVKQTFSARATRLELVSLKSAEERIALARERSGAPPEAKMLPGGYENAGPWYKIQGPDTFQADFYT